MRDALEARLATQLGFGPADVTLTCEGVLIGQPLVPALAVVITGHAGGAAPETMRAITSADGTRDLVALAPAPGRTLVGVGDLDQDGSDELVMIGTTTLVVTQVSPDALVDLPGPALATGCSANANVERDFRNGRPGSRKLLVITVDDPAPRKGCPAEGRHYYELRDAAIVELP